LSSGYSKTQLLPYNIKSLYVGIGNIVKLYKEENYVGEQVYRYLPEGYDITRVTKSIKVTRNEPAVVIFGENNFMRTSKEYYTLSRMHYYDVISSPEFSMKISPGIIVTLEQPPNKNVYTNSLVSVNYLTSPLIEGGDYTYEDIKPMISNFDLTGNNLNISMIVDYTPEQVKNYIDPYANANYYISKDISKDEISNLLEKAINKVLIKTSTDSVTIGK